MREYLQDEIGATEAQGALADSAVQPGDNVSTLTNDSGFLTNLSTSVIDDLSDVDTTGKSTGRILEFDASGNLVVGDKSAGGTTSFLGLTDTPSAYTGQSGKIATVNGTEDGLEFTEVAGAGLVDSVFGRIGPVTAQASDYTSSLIDNLSSVTGNSVTDALNTLQASQPDISGKMDTITPAVEDSIIVQDATGNAKDSGVLISSFAPVATSGSYNSLSDKPTISSFKGGVFNIEDFGADNTGVASSYGAIQGAINAAQSVGGGTVFIPAGRFRRANSDPTITITNTNINIEGVGDASAIFHDDRADEGRSDLFFITGGNVKLKKFMIEGTAEDFSIPITTNYSQTITGNDVERFRMFEVTIKSVHNMAITMSRCDDVLVSGCSLENVVRDGYRFTAGRKIRVIGCNAKNVADDVVAVHSIDSTRYAENVIVQGCNFELCQSMKFLGAKNVTVEGNIFDRGMRAALWIANNESTEGNTNIFNVKVVNNTFLNIFNAFGTNSIVNILGRDTTSDISGDQPGFDTVPYPYNYTNDIVDNVTPVMPFQNVEIRGNTFARTLPAAADYADYGYGQFFDRVLEGTSTIPPTSYFRAQEITDTDFNTYAINIDAPIRNLKIEENTFDGHRLAPVRIQIKDRTVKLPFETLHVKRNDFNNTGTSSGSIVWFQDFTSGIATPQFTPEVCDNSFDGDPYFVSSGHNSDNTWAADNSLTAILVDNGVLRAVEISGNTFKNVSQTGILEGAGSRVNYPNVCYSDYSTNISSANQGIRSLPEARSNVLVKINGNPASSSFRETDHYPEISAAASSFPLTGFWPYGHYIKNRAPATISDPSTGTYVVDGWIKLATNNNGAVDGSTGFAELRSFIGNIS